MKKSTLYAVLAVLAIAVSLIGVRAEGAKKKADITVSDGTLVKLHYVLTVDGEVVDDSRERDPMEITVGSEQVIPGFEKGIIGMKEGEKKSFEVSPEDGYGPEDPEAVQTISRANMPPDLELVVGMVLYAQNPEGDRFPAKVVEIKEDAVVMNFNHPLAGKTLNFEVEIISISEE